MSTRHGLVLVLGVVLLALVLCGGKARGQAPSAPAATSPATPGALQPELRLDGFGVPRGSVQLGAGGVLALGHYLRLSAVGAAGLPGTAADVGFRGDLIARFLLDPFRQSRWGVALGGGVSIRHERTRGTRPVLALTVDVDPPGARSWQPSVQVGLGGGVRAGVGLRRTRPMRR